MRRITSSKPRRRPTKSLCSAAGAAALLALGGCQVKQNAGDQVSGKKLFVGKCGSCHILARAQTKGVVGPNLDQAFVRAVDQGFKRSTVRGIVFRQVLNPNRTGVMPSAGALKLSSAQVNDVASYVSSVVAKPGKDSGALATAVGGGQKALVQAAGGKAEIDADPNGQLLFQAKAAQAKPGKLTLTSKNASSTPHNIAVQGPGANAIGPIGSGGHVSTVTVNLTPGTYTFYCSVPGHRQAGMQGKLTVK
jgi:mono/diheme cytochrome c family protein